MTPDGVQGIRCARPCTSLPTLTGMKAVDVLVGIDRVEHPLRARRLPIAAGSGDCTRMPSWPSLAFSRRDERQQIVERRGGRQPLQIDPQPGRRCPP